MSSLKPEPESQTPIRIGPKLAGAFALIGVLLLMGFSLAVHQWASNPHLSVAAGGAAVALVTWIVRRVFTMLSPGSDSSRKPTSPTEGER